MRHLQRTSQPICDMNYIWSHLSLSVLPTGMLLAQVHLISANVDHQSKGCLLVCWDKATNIWCEHMILLHKNCKRHFIDANNKDTKNEWSEWESKTEFSLFAVLTFFLVFPWEEKKEQATIALPIAFVLLCLLSSPFAWLSIRKGSKGFLPPPAPTHGAWFSSVTPHGCVAEQKDWISGFLVVHGQAAAEGFQLPLELKAVVHQWDLETQRGYGVNVGVRVLM